MKLVFCYFQRPTAAVLALPLAVSLVAGSAAAAKEYKSGIEWKEPPVVTPPAELGSAPPPEDAIVLFGGSNLDAWENGESWVIEDGVATAAKRGVSTRQGFGDCQLHVEWASPDKVKTIPITTANAAPCTSSVRRWPTPAASRASGRATTFSSGPRDLKARSW